MSDITIKFQTDNDSFKHTKMAGEVNRILGRAVGWIAVHAVVDGRPHGQRSFDIDDSNGNTVGVLEINETSEETK